MQNVLITGGAGYIGSHAVWRFLQEGCRVVVLDNLTVGRGGFVPSAAQLIFGNVGNAELVDRVIKTYHIDTVVHFAAYIDVAESVRKPKLYFENNAENTAVLAKVSMQAGVKHFIFSSTAAVYGNPAENPVSEKSLLKPINPYGESKLQAEQAIAEVARGSSMRYMILRYFNVAGAHPEQKCGYPISAHPTHLIRAALKYQREGKKLGIFGTDYPTPDGTGVRDYIHVYDLASAHVCAGWYLESGKDSDILNVGYGKGYSVRDVLQSLRRVTRRSLLSESKQRREGDVAAIVADTTKIRSLLPWHTKYDSLDTMVRDQWQWEEYALKHHTPRQ